MKVSDCIRWLYLHHPRLKKDDLMVASTLSKRLIRHKVLKIRCVVHIPIRDLHMESLLIDFMTKHDKTLTHLDVSRNRITRAGAEDLMNGEMDRRVTRMVGEDK